LSLETLSHNEGMKSVIAGTDDTGKTTKMEESSSEALNNSGVSDTRREDNRIQENEHLQEVLEDFIKINTAFHSVEIISASGQTIAYMVENGVKMRTGRKAVRDNITSKMGRDRTVKATSFQM